MSQQDQHLTTEQLSTLLDQQLTPEEQAAYRAHLLDCEQCQHTLDNLQQTVKLLQSLPQLEVPRSFALPADFKIAFDHAHAYEDRVDEEEETQIARNAQKQFTPITAQRKSSPRKLPTSFRRTLRTLSALAAVVGLFFALSGFVATLSLHIGGSSASSTGMANSSTSSTDTTQPTKIGSKARSQGQVNGSNTDATITPMPITQPPNTPQPHSMTTQNLPSGTNTTTGTGAASATSTAGVWLTLPFLDFNLPGVRLSIGILLVFLGGMGFRLFARR